MKASDEDSSGYQRYKMPVPSENLEYKKRDVKKNIKVIQSQVSEPESKESNQDSQSQNSSSNDSESSSQQEESDEDKKLEHL